MLQYVRLDYALHYPMFHNVSGLSCASPWSLTFRLYCANQFVERYDNKTTDHTVRLLSVTVTIKQTMSRISFAFPARVLTD